MKYNNKKVIYDNIKFDSKLERDYYIYLKKEQEQGKFKSLELQKEFILQDSFKFENKTIRKISYIADFVIIHNDGTKEIIDTKGVLTDIFKMKLKMFKYRYNENVVLVKRSGKSFKKYTI